MTPAEALAIASDVLYREAQYLDERRWDDWLALYHEQAEYWIPAWKNETDYTSDPNREISLIYIASRVQLGERVARVRSGRSSASTPLPRTAHAVNNVMAHTESDGALAVSSVMTTHLFDLRQRAPQTYFGRCEHRLQQAGGAWLIRRKKIVILNDTLPTAVDFYTV